VELRARVAELTELLQGTHADLAAANEALRDANELLRRANETLREAAGQEGRIAALESSLEAMEAELERRRRESSRHSGNSGKPPSSDTLAQKAAKDGDRLSRSERRRIAKKKLKKLTDAEKPKRRPGKQPGDPGSSLAKVVDPDFTELHVPGSCGACGESLEDAETTGRESRQVFDLPTRRLEATEHTSESRRCGCGHVTKAPFPAEAKAPTSYGPRVRAVGLYLMAGQHIPVARAAALLAQVCGAPVSTGFLAGLAAEAADGLGEFREALRSILVAEDVLHADETGARISGARYWFHVACTDLVTLLDCHERRGTEAFSDMGVLPFFSGVLVSDGWKPYWSIGAFEHALCAAHYEESFIMLISSGISPWWQRPSATRAGPTTWPTSSSRPSAPSRTRSDQAGMGSIPTSSCCCAPGTPSSSSAAWPLCRRGTHRGPPTVRHSTCFGASSSSATR